MSAMGKNGVQSQKPSLAEIFAALSGITCASVTLSKNGVAVKSDALVTYGVRAAMKTLNMKISLVQQDTQEKHDVLARDALGFLKAAASVMIWHRDVIISYPDGRQGKSVSDVIDHIEGMLAREKNAAEPRPFKQLTKGGVFSGRIRADYLPARSKSEGQYDEAEENAAPQAKSKNGYNGHTGNYSWGRRSFVPAS